ncbi:hypothetical protein [Xenorhabdus sp. KK7.4]|uniref:hypothetical protein n=1 Tax=Xenorhabdus sp. KK7.4 TaxID=1851572 RepID=UPI000C03E6B6|nr:hypothetical protein [Xenorhabdus sp. KK7.4]PHM52100.1 hypothetical protein Xekk_03325 [Xenorhabdus sp. KK7.4]
MIDKTKYALSTTLSMNIGPSDQFLMVALGLAGAMTPAAGTHYYLTMKGIGSKREVVLVNGASGNKLHVERGTDSTVAQSWPAGTCLYFDWNPAQLCEMIAQCTDKGIGGCITPGCYALSCDTIITVDAAGHITHIDGEAKPCSEQS